MRLLRRLILSMFVAVVLVIIIAVVGSRSFNSVSSSGTAGAHPGGGSAPDESARGTGRSGGDIEQEPELPPYDIVVDTPYDAPVKTQVELRVVVTEKPTPAQLRAMLETLFGNVRRRTGFKYHSHPTAVYIYVHAKQCVDTRGDGWIGMLAFNDALGKDGPDITINIDRLDAVFLPPEDKFGLTEEQRKRVYWELAAIEDNARVTAEEKHPLPKPNAPGYSEEEVSFAVRKQRQLAGRIESMHKRRLGEQYELTEEQLLKIATEGTLKGWPMPPLD
jgi:hypothetical protein